MFNLQGNDAAVRMLESALTRGRMHHAYLLTGPAHVGKMTLALQLAQAVNCEHPEAAPCGTCGTCTRIAAGVHADVQVLRVDADAAEGPRTIIGIDAVRELIGSAHLRPYEGRSRVFIFGDADRLSHDAAHALLKVLEEPPPDVLLVLLSADPDALLPTITSRCQRIDLRPMPVERVAQLLVDEHGAAPEQAQVIARMSRGCLGWAIEAAREPSLLAGSHQQIERIAGAVEEGLEGRFAYADDLARRFTRDRAEGREELYQWLRWLRDILLIQEDRGEDVVNLSWRGTLERQAGALTPAETVRWTRLVTDTLERLDRNANTRLALEALMLEAPG